MIHSTFRGNATALAHFSVLNGVAHSPILAQAAGRWRLKTLEELSKRIKRTQRDDWTEELRGAGLPCKMSSAGLVWIPCAARLLSDPRMSTIIILIRAAVSVPPYIFQEKRVTGMSFFVPNALTYVHRPKDQQVDHIIPEVHILVRNFASKN